MKKNISILLLLACTMGLFWSCEKGLTYVSPASTTEGMAFIKFAHASPNFRQVYKGADSFNVYVNGVKINGAQLSYGALFPTATNLYAAVPAGPQSIRITVNGRITPDSITLISLNKTLVPGGYYSLILTDEALTANESRQMWLRDQFALNDTNNYTLRFVHAVLSDPTPVDVYSFRKAKNLFTGITPGSATQFITLEYTILPDTFYIRPTGTLTNTVKIAIVTGSTTAATRSRAYTLLYRGLLGSTTKPRVLTYFAND